MAAQERVIIPLAMTAFAGEQDLRPTTVERRPSSITSRIAREATKNLYLVNQDQEDVKSYLTKTGRLSRSGSMASTELLAEYLDHPKDKDYRYLLRRAEEVVDVLQERRKVLKRGLRLDPADSQSSLELKMVNSILRQARNEKEDTLINLELRRMVTLKKAPPPSQTGCQTRDELVAKVLSLHHIVGPVFCPREHLQGGVFRKRITPAYLAGLATLRVGEYSVIVKEKGEAVRRKRKGVLVDDRTLLSHPFFVKTEAAVVMEKIDKALKPLRRELEAEERLIPGGNISSKQRELLIRDLRKNREEQFASLTSLMVELRDALPRVFYFTPESLVPPMEIENVEDEKAVGKASMKFIREGVILRHAWNEMPRFQIIGTGGREVLNSRLAEEVHQKENKERLKHQAHLALATAVGPMVAAGLMHFGPKLNLAQGERVIPGFLAGIALSQLAIQREIKNGNGNGEKLNLIRRFRNSMILTVAIMAPSLLDSTKIDGLLRTLTSKFPEEEVSRILKEVERFSELVIYKILRQIPWDIIGDKIRAITTIS